MSLPEIKQKLIAEIQASDNEALMLELLVMVEHYHAPPLLSDEQVRVLEERINKVEEGRGVYLNAKEEAEKIKKRLNGL